MRFEPVEKGGKWMAFSIVDLEQVGRVCLRVSRFFQLNWR